MSAAVEVARTIHPMYSGPGRSGICVCGCSWKDHHLCVVMNEDYFRQTGEEYSPGECEHYGFNELGGKKLNEATGQWENHCHGYCDRGC